MDEFLKNIGFNPLVADFIAQPEVLHLWTSLWLAILIIGVAYLIRIDLDPLVMGHREPFSRLIERMIFYPLVIGLLLWTYYGNWKWPDQVTEGFYLNKLTIGCGLISIFILGRSLIHFFTTEKSRWGFFDQLPYYLMVQFQFAVPLVYYYQLERNGLMPKEELGFAYACIFIAYFIIRWLLGRKTYYPRNPVAKWLWLFIAYMLLTVIFMPYRLAAVKNVIQWVAFAACFFIGLAYIPDSRRRDAVLLAAILAALVCTLWGFWKYFDLPLHLLGKVNGVYPEGHDLAGQSFFYRTPTAGRYFLLAGFFANPNYYGEYLAVTLFLSLGLLLKTDSLKLRIFLAIVLAVNSFEEVALYNRAGWFGIFFGAAFVLFGLLWARVPIFKRITKAGLIAGLCILIAVLLLTSSVFNRREADTETPLAITPLERLKSMTDFRNDETFRNRLTMWSSARLMLEDKDHFPERLIFGGGFGFFEVEYLVYQTKVLETYNFDEWFHNVIPTFRAHSDHLQMLVEAGIIGTFFYAMFFGTFFWLGFKFLKEEEDPGRRFFALGIMGGTASLLATAFFSFPLHQIQQGGLICTAMGILIFEIVERGQLLHKTAVDAESEINNVGDEDRAIKHKKKKKKRKEQPEIIIPAPAPSLKRNDFTEDYYLTIQKKVRPEIAYPLIVIVFLLCVWGVYTQVINFKSQYYVVRGIEELRKIEYAETTEQRLAQGQVSASFFWLAYKMDPTNGRAEFFHGFALIKKNDYRDVVQGCEHLEQGQLLYPQSDTYYALAMGYEARHNLADEQATLRQDQIEILNTSLATMTDPAEIASTRDRINELNQQIATLQQDSTLSHSKAIDAYMTAANYYPVKVEYYKELIRLLEEEGRWSEIVFWAERALVVDDWLLKKPPIRWRLYLWLGRALKILGGDALQAGNVELAFQNWSRAEEVLLEGLKISNAVYFTYFELAQVYEAIGNYYKITGDAANSTEFYVKARDMYIQVYNKKDNMPEGDAPFNYAYFLLGRIYEKLNDSERALEYYRQTMTNALYSPNTDTYQRARTRIHDITGVWEGEPPPGGIISEEPQPGELPD
ncbi:MAG: O-antigen ligase family protein [bacterium]|nr:O-antigen ligase family protein [bacterium]